jgi:hypothetical protein
MRIRNPGTVYVLCICDYCGGYFKLCSMRAGYVYTIGIAVAAPLIVVPVAEGSSVPDVVKEDP